MIHMKSIKKIGSIVSGTFLILFSFYVSIFKGVRFFEESGSPYRFRGPAMIMLLMGIALFAYGFFLDKFENGSKKKNCE